MATAERNDEAPNSAPLGAMGTLLRRLDMLPCTDDGGCILELKDYIHSIKDKLKKLSEVQDPPLTVNYWMKHARELSYDIEAYLDGLDAQTEDNLSDSDAMEEDNLDDSDAKVEDCIDDSDDETEDSVDDSDTTNMDDSIDDSDNKISGFRTRAKGMMDRYQRFSLDSVLSCPTAATTIVSPPPSRDVVLVGMGNEIMRLISLLQLKDQHHNQLKIVSILGDEGIGKSTLIQEIWHESFKERKIWPEPHSEVKIKRAFVRMGKNPDVRIILRSILSQVSLQEPAKDSGVTNLIQDIRKHLEQKRYFIIVDDVRSLSVWDVVGRAFPHCSVGSRIITTTSDKEVALSCCNYVLQHNYIMRPLNVGDCKELFIRTVVGSRTVNLQLSNDVSDEIKRKCGGLPLAIMWTAILMASQSEIKEKLCQLETEQGRSKMEKEENLDSDVKKFLDKNLRIESTPVEILNQVLKLCYSSLPHYLKTCLLYLSVYPENYFFLKEDLVKLWIAEGFICTSEEDKVEVAGRYFDVLVSLGLIQRMDINCNKQHHQGEVIEDEGEEYPLRVPYVVHPTAFDFITSKSTEDNFITIIDYSQLTVAFKEKIRRLSLHFGSAPYATTPSSTGLSQVRTLSFMGLLSCVPSLVEFKLVRVLILHLWDDDGDKKFPLAEICKLLLLKYLQVRCNVTVELPSHIGCLKHLETLEINSVVTAIPSDVFHLSRLLHLRLGLKQNLTLGPVAAVTAICSDELLPPMDDSSSTSVSIPSVQIFELLLHICIFSRLPKWIPQLCKLSILEIVVRELFTTDIDMLADLPELTALSLYVRIPTAGNIVFCRGAFKALRYFRFMCGVLSLDFQEEAMPNLQQLMIGFNVRRREKYNNILTGIQHLLNLQEVVASIGPTMGTEEIDRIAAESALKDAINKHPRPTKFKVKREHQVEEEYCSMPPKRRREGSGGSGTDGGGEGGAGAGREGGGGGGRGGGRPTQPPPPLPRAPPLKRRCRSFDLETRGCRHIQELTARVEAVEAAISRIPEELRKVLASYSNIVPGARVEKNLPPTYKLIFVNSMSDKIYTKRDVRAVDGGNIKIKMVVSNQQDGNCPRLLSSNVKIVVLDGDFNVDNHEGWTPDEFEDHIVRPRDRVGAVLKGNLCVKLKDGEAYLHGITFIDNSRFTRSGKFRLGVKLLDDLGERVQEGVTEPFTVRDRRGEGYSKREIPRLDDEVWRLKKIAKGGVFHMALEANGIFLVKHLMRLYHKDVEALRNILGNASQYVWTAIIDHAKTCDPGISLYSHFIEDKNTRLYVSSLGQIVGATIAGQYNAFGDLDMLKKALVEKLSKDAYKCITYYLPDYEMYNGQPRPINCSTLQESIIPGQKPTEPDDQNIHETDEQGTSKVKTERLGSVRVRTLSPVENNETDVHFDIGVQLVSSPAFQYEMPEANYTPGSVTLHCPTTATNEIIASVALDQTALTIHQEDYQTSFPKDST